ncbi:MAG TPA: hypothetical protein VHF58_04025 [Solirubrobacterales bacterium]|nr:hypothetical protein [Solirubrobacterales bacterium]
MNHRKTALALAAVTAIAAPAAAFAKPGNGNGIGQGHGHGNPHGTQSHGHGIGPAKGVAYVFKGTYAGAGVVSVTKGNARVRKGGLVGTDVTFDLSAARLSVADTNLDSAVTIDDVVVGDKVVVKAKLPKSDPGAGPYAARQLVDQTHPAEDEEPVAPVVE